MPDDDDDDVEAGVTLACIVVVAVFLGVVAMVWFVDLVVREIF